MAQKKTNSGKKAASSKKKTDTKAKKNTAAETSPPPPPLPPIRRELWGVVCLFLAVFLIISYFNTDGAFIAFFANLIKGVIGCGFWLSAPAFAVMAYALLFHKGRPVALRVSSALFIPIIFAALYQLLFCDMPLSDFDLKLAVEQLFTDGQMLASGGVIGGLLGLALEAVFSIYGAVPIIIVIFAFLIFVAFNLRLSELFGERKPRAAEYDPALYQQEEPAPVKEKAKPARAPAKTAGSSSTRIRPRLMDISEDNEPLPIGGFDSTDSDASTVLREDIRRKVSPVKTAARAAAVADADVSRAAGGMFKDFPYGNKTEEKTVTVSAEIADPPKGKKISRAEVDKEAMAVACAIEAKEDAPDYVFPPISLLKSSAAGVVDAKEEILLNRERLENAIRSFGINASIVGIIHGPTVTRYDIELEQGVKLARVTNLAGDLALALGVVNVRIAPIPDMISTVGIEVPNKIVSMVYLRDILESPKFSSAKSKLSFAIGKDIGGDCKVGNIAKLPHMLIAGTTGSGKSVCMNSLILSLLYKARPEEVRLIMIDPKMVELGIYNGIPHLYVPVVTDPKKAAGALQWSVVEMLKRYRMFSEIGVRNIEGYNEHCRENGEDALAQVVIVIDELADLMLVASKEVEESICRVAQMGRAAGMHLIIATQRPSADVITGLMKANIPSRIAFAVSSALESRIILDQAGAEKLVGNGDMLFSPVGSGKPTRIQGAFVSDEEREEVINFIKANAGDSQQNSEIEEYMNKAAENKSSAESEKNEKEDSGFAGMDEMLPQAVEAILESGSCSVSMLQRRVKLGYSRAARIVDQMEELGIVGPYEGAKPRQVVIDRAGWHELQIRLGLIEGDTIMEPESDGEDEAFSFE